MLFEILSRPARLISGPHDFAVSSAERGAAVRIRFLRTLSLRAISLRILWMCCQFECCPRNRTFLLRGSVVVHCFPPEPSTVCLQIPLWFTTVCRTAQKVRISLAAAQRLPGNLERNIPEIVNGQDAGVPVLAPLPPSRTISKFHYN